MNYFENIYLGKANSSKSIKADKKLQKLLTAKALHSSIDSKKLSSNDFKKMQVQNLKGGAISNIDFDSYIHPFENI